MDSSKYAPKSLTGFLQDIQQFCLIILTLTLIELTYLWYRLVITSPLHLVEFKIYSLFISILERQWYLHCLEIYNTPLTGHSSHWCPYKNYVPSDLQHRSESCRCGYKGGDKILFRTINDSTGLPEWWVYHNYSESNDYN